MDVERAAEELTERKVVRRGLITGAAALGAAALVKLSGTEKAEAAHEPTDLGLSITNPSGGGFTAATTLLNASISNNPGFQVVNGGSAASGKSGIVGVSDANGGGGVRGYNDTSTGFGVGGNSVNGIGVKGVSTNNHGVWGESNGTESAGVYGSSATGPGVYAFSNGSMGIHAGTAASGVTIAGVYGEAASALGVGIAGHSNSSLGNGDGLGSGTGVFGKTGSGVGVSGQAGSGAGVQGQAGTSGVGARGVNTANGTGIKGVSNTGGSTAADGNGSGIGVHGKSSSGDGVRGEAQSGNGVQGFSPTNLGVLGVSQSGAGVWGQSSTYVGVVGYSIAGAIAVFGNSQGTGTGVYGTSNGGSGVIAVATTANTPALHAENSVGGAGKLAARFVGDVLIQGSYTATGTKSAIVPHPDGTMRTLYCTEATEALFEDYGRAQLVGGVARVHIDADFAPLVRRDAYHVFPVAEGDCRGLFISQKDAGGFEVRELQGGKSSVPFSYRIIAKRVDVVGERLKRVDARVLTSTVQKAPPALGNTPGAGGPIQPLPVPTQNAGPNGNTPAPFVPTVPPANVVPVPFNPITPPGFGQYMPPGLPPTP